MEVTTDNLETALPLFIDILTRCEFYSIDCEMTGIRTAADENVTHTFLSVKSCVDPAIFDMHNKVARRYNIIQLGVTCFVKYQEYIKNNTCNSYFSSSPLSKCRNTSNDSDTFVSKFTSNDSFVPCSFNFYLFPYVEATTDNIASKTQLQLDGRSIRLFLTQHSMDFNKWICKGIFCKALPLSYYTSTTSNDLKDTSITVDVDKMKNEIKSLLNSKPTDPIGNVIFMALLASKKQMVIHSGLNDLLFIHYAFCNELIKSPAHMKKILHAYFPLFTDTKQYAMHSYSFIMKSTGLANIFDKFCNNKDILEKITFQNPFMLYSPNTASKNKAHNASYDSYMTGIFYLFLKEELRISKNVNNIIYVHESVLNYSITSTKDTYYKNNNLVAFIYKPATSLNVNQIKKIITSNGFNFFLRFYKDGFVIETKHTKKLSDKIEKLSKALNNDHNVTIHYIN